MNWNIFRKKRFVRRIRLYISNKHEEIIIVPLCQEGNDGIIFEQKICETLPLDSDDDILGEAIKRNMQLFKIVNSRNDLNGWTGFENGKEKTKTAFENYYKRISVTDANEYNLIFLIETVKLNVWDLEISSSISAYADNVNVGNKIRQVHNSEILRVKP